MAVEAISGLKELQSCSKQPQQKSASTISSYSGKKPAKQDVVDFEEKIATRVYKSLKSSFPDIEIPD
jgi:hypothetical protein